MEENFLRVLSKKKERAIRFSWVLLLLFIATEGVISMGWVFDRQVINNLDIIIFGLTFSWYFICNESWLYAMISFGLAAMFKFLEAAMFSAVINDLFKLNEYLFDDWSVLMVLKMIVFIATSFVLAFLHLKEEKIRVSTKKLLLSASFIAVFIFAVNSVFNQSYFLSILLSLTDNSLIIEGLYGLIISVYLISLLFFAYFMLDNSERGTNLFSLPKHDLKVLGNNFFKTFFMLYHCIIMGVILGVMQLLTSGMALMFRNFDISDLLFPFSTMFLLVLFVIIAGQMLRIKAKQEKSYFGLFGVLLFIPFLNILFYLLIGFNKRFTLLGDTKLYSSKALHVIGGVILMGILIWNEEEEVELSKFFMFFIIYLMFFLVSIVNFGKLWQVALVFSLIILIFKDLFSVLFGYDGLGSASIALLLSLGGLLMVIVKFLWFFCIAYILRYSYLKVKEWKPIEDE